MIGLSTIGSISFGWAFVAGRNRVPSPAAGKTALRTFAIIDLILPSPIVAPPLHSSRCGLRRFSYGALLVQHHYVAAAIPRPALVRGVRSDRSCIRVTGD